MKSIPKNTWLLSLLCLIVPMLPLEEIELLSQLVWYLHLVPIYLFTYRLGYKGGFIALIVDVIVLAGWSFFLNYQGYNLHLHDFFLITFFETCTWFGVGYITAKLRKHQISLEEANKLLIFKKKKLEEVAYKDYLTGLPNRYALNKYWDNHITSEDEEVAVLFLDLDRFKLINDSLGHDVGDQMIQESAKRIQAVINPNDIVSRTGGDEFIVLLKDTNSNGARLVAKKILDSFSDPIVAEGHTLYTQASIGISLYPHHDTEKSTLIRFADQAMYEAKGNGGNAYFVYSPQTSCQITRQVQIEQGLHNALIKKELEVYYQPIVCLRSNRTIGVEALIRWNHPRLGMVSPMEFIPVAEESGLIIPIGEWILYEACRQTKMWQSQGVVDIQVSVNVSLRQFRSDSLVDSVKRVLLDTGLHPEHLKLEITESMMHNIEESKRIMRALKDVGVKLSLDDFGTGYSSLNVLSKLPIDYLKIDRSFVQNITTDPVSLAIVKTIIELGKNLNFKLIAEGVEREDQSGCLLENKTDFAQGYLYSKPLPAHELEQFLFHVNKSAC